MNTLPHKVSAVSVSEPIDGTRKRRPRKFTDHRGETFRDVIVSPLVLRAAKKARRSGEKLYLIDEHTVRLDHKGS